jgi:cytochrome c5
MKNTLFVLLFFAAALSGCYFDNYKELYPKDSLTNSCDTDSVTYSKQVSYVFNTYCVGCHSSSVANDGVELDTYSSAMSAAQNYPLVACITNQNNNLMPPTGSLDACSIREVELWIQNNYPQ